MNETSAAKGKRPAHIPAKARAEAEVSSEDAVARSARELADLKDQEVRLDKALKEIRKTIEDKEGAAVELMRARGLDLFKINGVGSFWTQPHNYPTVKDRAAFLKWLRDTKQDALIKEDVPWPTLRAFVTERLGDAKPLPAGVENFTKMKMHYRRVPKRPEADNRSTTEEGA